MKILIIHPKMELYGGAELVIVKLAEYLRRNGISHALLTTAISKPIEEQLKGTRVITHPFQKSEGLLKPLNLAKTIRSLHSGVRQYLSQFDLINVHNYPAELSAVQTKKPVVWMCNEPPEVEVGFHFEKRGSLRRLAIKTLLHTEKYLVRKLIRSAVVADNFNKRRFERIYGFSPVVIPYGIDHDFFSSIPRRSRMMKSQWYTVLQVGIISPMKNQFESVKTVEKLKHDIPNIRLVLAGLGEGAYYENVKQYIRQKGLEELITITGHINRRRIRELYHSSHVLMHPIKSQGGWLAPFEALCTGLPVVVSPEMSAAEIFRDEKLGTVTTDYVGGIRYLFDNMASCNDTRTQRSNWVKNHLSWDNYCEKMVLHFEEALRKY